MEETDIAVLTYVSLNGHLVSTPMGTQDFEDPGTTWFLTERSSDKVRAIEADPRVNVSYSSKAGWVSLTGTAHVSDDRAKLRDLWDASAGAFMSGGPDDPDNVLLRIDGATAEYWSPPARSPSPSRWPRGSSATTSPTSATTTPCSSERRRLVLVDAHGPATADESWRRFATPATWPSWAPLIREVEASDDVLGVGTTGRVHGPGGVVVDFEVTGVDPVLRSWTWRAGIGPAAVSMDHHVVPAPGGSSRAMLRVPSPAAALLQPYRLPAGAALRALVGEPGGEGAPEAVESFDFAFAPNYVAPARAFGVTPATTTVEVGPAWLFIRYGPWRLVTPRSNLASAELTGGFAWHRTAGPRTCRSATAASRSRRTATVPCA